MANQSKVSKAIQIVQQQGLGGLVNRIRKSIKYRTMPHAPDEIEIAFDTLKASQFRGTMFDVGAHIGGALEPFAKAGWQVYAFEPDSKNRAKLVEKFGEMTNINIDIRAVSDEVKENVTLYQSDQSTGLSTLSSFHSSHSEGEGVSVTTMASFLEEKAIVDQEIDFIKIDVEGFDFFVLKGIPWEQCMPRLILCEFEDLKTKPLDYTFHDMATYLKDKGYQLVISEWYPIKRYGEPHSWRRFVPYPCQLADEKAWGNIFAVRDADVYGALLKRCKLK